MRSRTTARRSAYAVGALFSALIACSGDVHDHDNFREDVVYCEEAVAYLGECCPGFDTHAVVCQYHHDYTAGCAYGGNPDKTDNESPALSLPESKCILGAKCGALIASGVCARAQQATPYIDVFRRGGDDPHYDSSNGTVKSETHAPVCHE